MCNFNRNIVHLLVIINKCCWGCIIFLTIGLLKFIVYVGLWMSFYPYFPRFFSDVGTFQCRGSANNYVERLRVFLKSTHWMLYFSYGCVWKYIEGCSLESNDVLKVTRAFAVSVYVMKEYTVAVLLSDVLPVMFPCYVSVCSAANAILF